MFGDVQKNIVKMTIFRQCPFFLRNETYYMKSTELLTYNSSLSDLGKSCSVDRYPARFAQVFYWSQNLYGPPNEMKFQNCPNFIIFGSIM